jgi:hypothetical protein
MSLLCHFKIDATFKITVKFNLIAILKGTSIF